MTPNTCECKNRPRNFLRSYSFPAVSSVFLWSNILVKTRGKGVSNVMGSPVRG